MEKVKKVFGEREEREEWALPVASKEQRESVNPGRWKWKKEEDEEGVGELKRVLEERRERVRLK